jgi:hypothetical protein
MGTVTSPIAIGTTMPITLKAKLVLNLFWLKAMPRNGRI